MPPYKVTVTLDDVEHTSMKGNAEGAWFHLMMGLLHGTTKFEITDTKTGKVSIVELDYKVEDDVTVLRHMMLTMIASQYLSEEQKAELQKWEEEYMDGATVRTSDWVGWEKIIGQKVPKKFRKRRFIKRARK